MNFVPKERLLRRPKTGWKEFQFTKMTNFNGDFKYLTPLDSNRGSVWETNTLFIVY